MRAAAAKAAEFGFQAAKGGLDRLFGLFLRFTNDDLLPLRRDDDQFNSNPMTIELVEFFGDARLDLVVAAWETVLNRLSLLIDQALDAIV